MRSILAIDIRLQRHCKPFGYLARMAGSEGQLSAIARVLRPGAELALVFRTNADARAVNSFPADVYSFRAFVVMEAPLTEAGFAVRDLSDASTPARPRLVVATRLPLAANATQGDLRHARETGECA